MIQVHVGRTPRGGPARTSTSCASGVWSRWPRLGRDRLELSTDRPELSTDRPELGADRPELGADRPELEPNRGKPKVAESADRGELGTDRGELGADRGELGTDRGELGADRGELPEGLRRRIRALGTRPRAAQLRPVLLDIVRIRAFTPAELAQVIGFSTASKLVERHLAPMVREGMLARTFPNDPTHPQQAYFAAQTSLLPEDDA